MGSQADHGGSGAAVTGLVDDCAAESQSDFISAPTEKKTQIAQILKVQRKETDLKGHFVYMWRTLPQFYLQTVFWDFIPG